MLVFCNLKEVKLFLGWGIGTQKDVLCKKDLIWGVSLDKLEQFAVGWIWVDVLKVLGFELFLVIAEIGAEVLPFPN